MAITSLDQSLKNTLNAANPNVVPDGMRIVKFGSILRALPTFLRKKATALSPYNLATVFAITLPEDAKAHEGTRAFARAGAGSLGELGLAPLYSVPAAGFFAVTPSGDLAFAAADAWTSVDVTYQPEKYDLAEVTLPVAANVLTLPVGITAPGVIFALEIEALAGTVPGKKIVLAPSNAAPAAGQANLNLTKTTVLFAVADGVTSARVKIGIVPSVDVDALLESQSQIA